MKRASNELRVPGVPAAASGFHFGGRNPPPFGFLITELNGCVLYGLANETMMSLGGVQFGLTVWSVHVEPDFGRGGSKL